MSPARFQFAVASSTDDEQLRQRMAEDWLEGPVTLSFRREPSFFAATAIQGNVVQVLKCTDSHTQRIVGLGTRAIRHVYLNGKPTTIGSLSDLRISSPFRKGTILARAAHALEEVHKRDPQPIYLVVILDGNKAAEEAVTKGRGGFPIFEARGRILTPAIFLDLPKRNLTLPGVTFRPMDAEMLPELLRFLNREYARKQYATICSAEYLHRALSRGLALSDFLVAIKENRIVASCAAWDQRCFRQTHVEAYAPALRGMRPFYNALAAMSPLKPLPRPGHKVPYFYLSFVATEDNNVGLFRVLLRQLYRARRQQSWHYFIPGLHASDPLAEVLNDYRMIRAAGQLYIGRYPGIPSEAPDSRVPYIEMATL